MYHPRFKGKHYEMGQKFGNILQKANIKFPIKLDDFQLKYGKESEKLLRKYFPEAAEEIKGITDTIGIDNEVFTAWMMCMGCCMYNLEDQNNIEARGCTAISFKYNGQIYYGRDNDLPPFLKKGSKSICYQPQNGNSFILNTSSFINGEEGINNYGLTVAMTFVMPKLEEIKPGFNSVFIVRYLLEKSKTVIESIETLKKLPIASSCNILLTDSSGEMVVVECNPLEIHIRYPEKNKKSEEFIVTVNHFTSKKMQKYDASDRNVYFSETRYQTAYNALKNIEYIDGIEHAKAILSGKHGFMCQYNKALNFETIWSSIFDISNNKIYIADGNPQRVKYIEDKRFPKQIKNGA